MSLETCKATLDKLSKEPQGQELPTRAVQGEAQLGDGYQGRLYLGIKTEFGLQRKVEFRLAEKVGKVSEKDRQIDMMLKRNTTFTYISTIS